MKHVTNRLIFCLLVRLLKGQHKMTETLDTLKIDADATRDAVTALVTRVDAIVAELRANAADPVKIQAIADELAQVTAAANAELPAPPPVPVP